jgi:serine/threonine-protein kinase PknG
MTKEACKQPGCAGIIEDGYCNICGLAQARPAPVAPSKASAPSRPVSGRSSSIVTGTGSTPVSHAKPGSRRSARSSSARSTRRSLGAGLISVPELPSIDPEKAIMADQRVPEHKRYCANCEKPLAREKGFCGQCGQKYSFIPTLRTGDLLAGQYEVKGALAYGGLGWIYLAFDRLLSRYVVLKGLLNTEDAAAAAVAVAERQFLAAVKHPNIVGIYNFVQSGHEGFIVMEYVGGQTLRDIRKSRGPLPPAEAIAYIHRILGAFSYLHQLKLVYCDFKPENVMLEHDDVKLIDLGGVRRLDDPKGDIYGTVGYSAPEANEGPTIQSDLFTIGRTLAVLLTEIRGFSKEHRVTLPAPDEEPLFAQQESLYRFLLRATAENPNDRFESADQMAGQLLGVLREIVAVESGTPRPAASSYFGGDLLSLAVTDRLRPVRPEQRQLPSLNPDSNDPGFNAVANAGALQTLDQRISALRKAAADNPKSIEARLRLAQSLIAAEGANLEEASAILTKLEVDDPWDWRVRWVRGCLFLAQTNYKEAQAEFDQVYFELPGEIAPKLGFAMAAELGGNYELAARMYELISRTDSTFLSASFGLARCLCAIGDRKKAAEALTRIPKDSSLHLTAQIETARAWIGKGRSLIGADELAGASTAIENVALNGMERYTLSRHLLETALNLITSGRVTPNAKVRVLGEPLREYELRRGLEKYYRAMAHLAQGDDRVNLVDEANRVRPRTLF